MVRSGTERDTVYHTSYPDHNPPPRINYYDFPSLQWQNFRTIRMKPAPHRIVEFDRPPGLGMGSMVSDNWYRFHLGHLHKPTVFKDSTEAAGPKTVRKTEHINDIDDIVKTKTLVSTNKAFYKSLPMVPITNKESACDLDSVRTHLAIPNKMEGTLPKLSRYPRFSRERKLPGYAGYIPNSPLLRPKTPQFSYDVTTHNSVHRTFPEEEHIKPVFPKSGSMSRHVTLTKPYNPFNKIH